MQLKLFVLPIKNPSEFGNRPGTEASCGRGARLRSARGRKNGAQAWGRFGVPGGGPAPKWLPGDGPGQTAGQDRPGDGELGMGGPGGDLGLAAGGAVVLVVAI